MWATGAGRVEILPEQRLNILSPPISLPGYYACFRALPVCFALYFNFIISILSHIFHFVVRVYTFFWSYTQDVKVSSCPLATQRLLDTLKEFPGKIYIIFTMLQSKLYISPSHTRPYLCPCIFPCLSLSEPSHSLHILCLVNHPFHTITGP